MLMRCDANAFMMLHVYMLMPFSRFLWNMSRYISVNENKNYYLAYFEKGLLLELVRCQEGLEPVLSFNPF